MTPDAVQPSECPSCEGTGVLDDRDEGFDSKKYPCLECDGSGTTKDS